MQTFQTFFKSNGIEFEEAGHRHVRTGWVGIDCPYCSPGLRKFRLGFEISTGRVSCWVCGILNGPKVISVLLRKTEKESRSIWQGLSRKDFAAKKVTRERGSLEIPKGVTDLAEPHRKYLRSRALSPEEISEVWGVKGIGMALSLRWRLWIPVYDKAGSEIVSWTTRSIDRNDPVRFVSAAPSQEVYSHKSQIYGQHLARHVVIISEGPVDAWSWGPGGVATLGLRYTQDQLNSLAEFPVRAICFDSEPAAQRRAHTLAEALCVFPGRTEVIELEGGKDANECLQNDPDEIAEVRRHLGLSENS